MVPLGKIVTVSEFSEEDQKKYKKLAKANDLGDPDTPTKKSQEYNFRDLHYLEEPYYVLSTGEIFPYDFEQAGGVGSGSSGGEQS